VLGTNFVNISLIALADGVFAGGAVVDTLGRFEALSALLGVLPTGVYSAGCSCCWCSPPASRCSFRPRRRCRASQLARHHRIAGQSRARDGTGIASPG
jgi:hypothetical protein